MEITRIEPFLEYQAKVRERTLKAIHCIPPEYIDWSYMPGKFSFGDIIRHIATIERYMYAENVQLLPSRYPGCGRGLADGYEATMDLFHRLHDESMEIFSRLSPEDLRQKCETVAGTKISVWKWLRAMSEHEIHHRAQIYIYLSLLGLPSAPIYGLTEEEVLNLSR